MPEREAMTEDQGGEHPILLGLTGEMGSGKTTAARLLSRARGWPLIEADVLGHEALSPGKAVAEVVARRFGPGVARPDGSIDRGALGRIVFADERALRDLNSLTHPWILGRIAEEVETLRVESRPDIILLDAAVLNLWLKPLRARQRLWVVLVAAPLRERLARVIQRGLSTLEALARMRLQAATAGLPERPYWTVVNCGSLRDLAATVDDLGRTIVETRRQFRLAPTAWGDPAAGIRGTPASGDPSAG